MGKTVLDSVTPTVGSRCEVLESHKNSSLYFSYKCEKTIKQIPTTHDIGNILDIATPMLEKGNIFFILGFVKQND